MDIQHFWAQSLLRAMGYKLARKQATNPRGRYQRPRSPLTMWCWQRFGGAWAVWAVSVPLTNTSSSDSLQGKWEIYKTNNQPTEVSEIAFIHHQKPVYLAVIGHHYLSNYQASITNLRIINRTIMSALVTVYEPCLSMFHIIVAVRNTPPLVVSWWSKSHLLAHRSLYNINSPTCTTVKKRSIKALLRDIFHG